MRTGIQAMMVAALFAVPTSFLAAGVPEIPQDPKDQEERELRRQERDARTLGGAYEKIGKKDPRWDEYARQAFSAAAPFFYDPRAGGDYLSRAHEATKKAIDVGCDDP